MSSDPFLPPSSEPDPLQPVAGATTPLATETTAGSSTGLAPNVAAGLSAVFTLLGGIVFLVIEKKNQFVRFWAMQSVLFGAAWFLFSIVSSIIGSVLGHIMGLLAILWMLVAMLVGLGMLVVWIITIIKAFSGQVWEIPVIGKMARQQLSNVPTL